MRRRGGVAGGLAGGTRGVRGRARLTSEQIDQAQQLYDSGTPVLKVARTFKVAPATIYRYITPKSVN
ncbi:helix-turn-helix domain-containing protein [Streptomyces cinnamoneus]|uniref:helix-turn-helix domain-containing protein n=1 Tax=Streptomyces cinnamoneus TaxID=53446 RepID=UPI00378C88FE